MEENKMPLLHISGTLTVDQYKTAARISGCWRAVSPSAAASS